MNKRDAVLSLLKEFITQKTTPYELGQLCERHGVDIQDVISESLVTYSQSEAVNMVKEGKRSVKWLQSFLGISRERANALINMPGEDQNYRVDFFNTAKEIYSRKMPVTQAHLVEVYAGEEELDDPKNWEANRLLNLILMKGRFLLADMPNILRDAEKGLMFRDYYELRLQGSENGKYIFGNLKNPVLYTKEFIVGLLTSAVYSDFVLRKMIFNMYSFADSNVYMTWLHNVYENVIIPSRGKEWEEWETILKLIQFRSSLMVLPSLFIWEKMSNFRLGFFIKAPDDLYDFPLEKIRKIMLTRLSHLVGKKALADHPNATDDAIFHEFVDELANNGGEKFPKFLGSPVYEQSPKFWTKEFMDKLWIPNAHHLPKYLSDKQCYDVMVEISQRRIVEPWSRQEHSEEDIEEFFAWFEKAAVLDFMTAFRDVIAYLDLFCDAPTIAKEIKETAGRKKAFTLACRTVNRLVRAVNKIKPLGGDLAKFHTFTHPHYGRLATIITGLGGAIQTDKYTERDAILDYIDIQGLFYDLVKIHDTKVSDYLLRISNSMYSNLIPSWLK